MRMCPSTRDAACFCHLAEELEKTDVAFTLCLLSLPGIEPHHDLCSPGRFPLEKGRLPPHPLALLAPPPHPFPLVDTNEERDVLLLACSSHLVRPAAHAPAVLAFGSFEGQSTKSLHIDFEHLDSWFAPSAIHMPLSSAGSPHHEVTPSRSQPVRTAFSWKAPPRLQRFAHRPNVFLHQA